MPKENPIPHAARFLEGTQKWLVITSERDISKGQLWIYNKDTGIWMEGYARARSLLQRWGKNHLDIAPSGLNDYQKREIIHSVMDEEEYRIKPSGFNDAADVLNMKNGIVHLAAVEAVQEKRKRDPSKSLPAEIPDDMVIKEYEKTPHDAAYRFTWVLPYKYTPNAKCEEIRLFLEKSLGIKGMEIMLEWFAYCLMPGSQIKKFLILVGPTDSGKTQMMNLLKMFLGNQNFCAVPLQELTTKEFQLARLYGKLANIYADLPDIEVKDCKKMNAITGGDTISASRKFKDHFDFVNQAKLTFSANSLPPVPGADEAFWNRVILLQMARRIPKKMQIDGYAKTLEDELPGLMNMVLEARQRLLYRGYFKVPNALEAAKTWTEFSDDDKQKAKMMIEQGNGVMYVYTFFEEKVPLSTLYNWRDKAVKRGLI